MTADRGETWTPGEEVFPSVVLGERGRGLQGGTGRVCWSPLAVRRHTRQAFIDGAVVWRETRPGASDVKKSYQYGTPATLGTPCHALQTHVQPTGRGLSTFKLLLDLFSYFIITYGKLMKHFIGPTTLDRTISSDR